jgi:hypothetical protein
LVHRESYHHLSVAAVEYAWKVARAQCVSTLSLKFFGRNETA